MTAGRPLHDATLTRREALLFEAGIKLGGVFHQYLGMPVSRRTAPALGRAIEQAVGLQPFVRRVTVRVDPGRGPPAGRGRFAYRYLSPEMLTVRVVLADGPVRVEARLAHRPDLRFPLMSVDRVVGAQARAPRSVRSVRRPRRRAGRGGRRTSPSAG